jgi:hypothetical protein
MNHKIDDFEQLANYVKSSFVWCNLAFGELWYLTQTPETKEEIELSRSHTFHFYGVALQYVIVMEYTKLLEANYRGKNNVASIVRLNQEMKKHFGEAFENSSINDEIINTLRSSNLFFKLKDLRDKKFAHTDGDYHVSPLSIKGFTGNEIDECANQLRSILQVINNCLKMLGYEFLERVPNRDNRTANFLKYHAKYQQYYLENFRKFNKEAMDRNVE